MKSEKNSNSNNKKKNVLEWIVFSLSVATIVAILIMLIYKTYSSKDFPPDILVNYMPSPTKSAPYRYHIIAKNTGGETAEEVNIELVLKKGGEITEKAALQLAYVPKASKQEGWLIFSQNPSLADTIFARVVSYKKP